MGLCEMDKRAKMADILRLEEYGLTPVDLPRAAELVKADKDGRCVVLDKPRKECSITETEKAIQEFEDEAYHHSLHPDISDAAKAVALAALREKQERDKTDKMKQLPVVDAAPVVHGRWKKCNGYTECSECEYWYDSAESEDDGDRSRFCPNCGARMDLTGGVEND